MKTSLQRSYSIGRTSFFQALDNYWSENIRYWAEKLKLVNEKYMAALWEIQSLSASNGLQNLQSHIVSLPNDLDVIIKEMKNSVLDSNRFSCQKKRNLEEPLDLSVQKWNSSKLWTYFVIKSYCFFLIEHNVLYVSKEVLSIKVGHDLSYL